MGKVLVYLNQISNNLKGFIIIRQNLEIPAIVNIDRNQWLLVSVHRYYAAESKELRICNVRGTHGDRRPTSVVANSAVATTYTMAAKLNQNLHWKFGQQTPSVGTVLAYLETTA